jgi:hypothetical protein
MNIPIDKQLHFLSGATIAFTVSLFGGIWLGFVVTAIVGLLKEVYDNYHPDKHTADVWDFIATGLGGLFAVIITLIANFINKI